MKKSDKNYEDLGKALAAVYESGYINHSKSLKMSFLKGVASGIGGVVGATLVLAVLLWILAQLGDIPFAGQIFENLRQTLDNR